MKKKAMSETLNTMNEVEGNKLIDAFCKGRVLIPNMRTATMGIPYKDKEGWYYEQHEVIDLKYHTSWDWLMPVVEKIEALKDVFEVSINSIFCIITLKNVDNEILYKLYKEDSKLKSTWLAVIEFIKWYNSQH